MNAIDNQLVTIRFSIERFSSQAVRNKNHKLGKLCLGACFYKATKNLLPPKDVTVFFKCLKALCNSFKYCLF